jgi:hypothetical protein
MVENTVIVNSCDSYEDVWDLFFCAFREYWPDCKYPIVLNTESRQRVIKGLNVRIHNLESMSDRDMWGKRLRQAIASCESKYVVMLYDDFILEGRVSDGKISSCLRWLDENPHVAVFYFSNIPVNANVDDGRFDGFELMPRTGDYKLNSAPSMWRRERLLAFIEDNDNPWAWEYFGSYRTYKSTDQFYCAKRGREDIYPYNYAMGGAIYRGKWVGKVVLPLIAKYGLNVDVNARGLADGIQQKNKRALSWKIRFFLLGFRMIGFGVFVFLFRILKSKILKQIRR